MAFEFASVVATFQLQPTDLHTPEPIPRHIAGPDGGILPTQTKHRHFFLTLPAGVFLASFPAAMDPTLHDLVTDPLTEESLLKPTLSEPLFQTALTFLMHHL